MSETRKMDFFVMWSAHCIFSYTDPTGYMELDLFVTDEILPKYSMDINTVEQMQSFLFTEIMYLSVYILVFCLNWVGLFKFSCVAANHHIFEPGNYIVFCIL